jgi:hypothetical protein
LLGTGVIWLLASSPTLSVAALLSTPKLTMPLPGVPAALNHYQLFLPLIQTTPPKKGIALTYGVCADATTEGAVWQYQWGPNPGNCPGVENIPMIRDITDTTKPIAGNSQWLMGFNEPDLASQANITRADAAVFWRQIEANNPTRRLLAPVPSQVYPAWIVDFRNAYLAKYGSPPRLDALAFHCYAYTASFCIQLAKTFEQWAGQWNVPEVWVTEFGLMSCPNSPPDPALQEARTFITWIENEPMITRMAWFAARIKGTEGWGCNNPLIDWNANAPSAFGSMYLGFR